MSSSFNLDEELKNIRRAVAKVPGIALDRVIGHGSYFWGNYTEKSDIDLAVIIARRDGECCSEKTKWTIRNFIDVSDCEHLVEDLFEIESVRTVTTCMQGKILARGVTLYANPRTTRLRKQAASQSLPYREAKIVHAITPARWAGGLSRMPVGTVIPDRIPCRGFVGIWSSILLSRYRRGG